MITALLLVASVAIVVAAEAHRRTRNRRDLDRIQHVTRDLWMAGLVDVAASTVLVSPRGTELEIVDGWTADDLCEFLTDIEAL